MTSALFSIARKLRLWGGMSSLWVLLCFGAAHAHEVVPTIADLTVLDGAVTFEMRVNIEAQLSGIDLDEVADTDEAENASDYDVLRALSNVEVAARATDLIATWDTVPLLSVATDTRN